MSRVAIVIDSASDMPPAVAARDGITIVPLEVSFGPERFRALVELSTDQFWERMLAPGAPLPTTAAASPGEFKAAFEAAFEQGAESIVCIDVAETLSGTVKSARVAAATRADFTVPDSVSATLMHTIDSAPPAKQASNAALNSPR